MAKKNTIKGMSPFSQTDWQVEDDLRTLMRAKEICRDKKRYAKVQALAKQKLTEMASVAGSDDAE